MKLLATSATLFVAAQSVLAQITLNTPFNLIECQPTSFTWVGGTGPFILFFTDGNVSGGQVIKDFENIAASPFVWKVDLQANTNFIANLKDSNGVTGQTSPLTILQGGTRDCENTSVVESGSGGAAATGGSNSTTAAGATTTPAGSTTTPAAGSNTSKTTTSSGATTTPTTKSGASQLNVGSLGVVGLTAFVGAMLF